MTDTMNGKIAIFSTLTLLLRAGCASTSESAPSTAPDGV